MKLVIDIPEEDYIFVKKQIADGITNPLKICIANGTPLPKGHGDLIDKKVAYKKFYSRCLAKVATEVFAEIPTIIKADKGE